jgi:uncharacterized protein YoxC
MNTLIQANIFFFIASIAFVILTVLLIIILIYIIGLLKNVRRITDKLEGDIEIIGDEAKELLSDMRQSVAFRFLFGGVKKRAASRHKKEDR